MCVGCRSRTAQSDLLRLVVVGAVITPDTAGRAPGRGAYLHPDLRCWEMAERRKVWGRAFRTSGGLDTARVAACFEGLPRVGVEPGSR
ncbi:YlxR family protein [Marinitenerispora sediminis]|nr:YlxR family protein [Marinitenerispora sediminis]